MFEALKSIISGKPRQKDNLPKPGKAPNINAYIVHQKIMMRVTEPLTQEFWDWLVANDWREIDAKADRSKFKRLTEGSFSRLARAGRQDRETIHKEMLSK